MDTGNPFIDGAIGVLDFGKNLVGDIVNYQNQKEEQMYQRQLQERIFDREDSAMQRGVQDAVKAGLSPLSATAASSGSIATSVTPQYQNKASLQDAAQFMMNLQTARQQIETGKAEENYYNNLAQKTKSDKDWNEYWNGRYRDLGITPNSSSTERIIANLLEAYTSNGKGPGIGSIASGVVGDVASKVSSADTGIPVVDQTVQAYNAAKRDTHMFLHPVSADVQSTVLYKTMTNPDVDYLQRVNDVWNMYFSDEEKPSSISDMQVGNDGVLRFYYRDRNGQMVAYRSKFLGEKWKK